MYYLTNSVADRRCLQYSIARKANFLGTARSPSALARLCPYLALSLAVLARTLPARLRKFLKIAFLALNVLVNYSR